MGTINLLSPYTLILNQIYNICRDKSWRNRYSTYYYGENRYHARFDWEERKIEDLPQMAAIDTDDRRTVRAQLSRNSGYTGLSVLHMLYKLYKFDVFKDLVFDVMPNIPLNVAANKVKNWIDSEVIDKHVVEERLKSFPWTAGTR